VAPPSRTRALIVAATLLAACETPGATLGGGGGGVGSGAPTARQRTELSLAAEDEMEAAVSALTLAAPGVPPSFVSAGCPSVVGTTDSDGDGIPDDQVQTYVDPPCSVTGFRGGTFAVTGTLEARDSTSADSTSYLLTLTNLAWTATDSGTGTRSYTATRNGSRTRVQTDSSEVLTSNLTIVRNRPSLANTTITLSTTVEFMPQTLVGQSLPSGQLVVNGTWHWTRSTEDWAITVSTPTPLVYDPTCTTTPQRITSGQLSLGGTINGADGTLTLTFSACGTDPTPVWVPAP
jgi:hypothetical protein